MEEPADETPANPKKPSRKQEAYQRRLREAGTLRGLVEMLGPGANNNSKRTGEVLEAKKRQTREEEAASEHLTRLAGGRAIDPARPYTDVSKPAKVPRHPGAE